MPSAVRSVFANFKELSTSSVRQTVVLNPHHVARRRYAAIPSIGEGFYEEATFEDVQLGYGNFRLNKSAHLELPDLEEVIEMRFTLSGNTQTHNLEVSEALAFGPEEHNLLYTAKDNIQISFNESDHHRFLIVRLLPSYFLRYFPSTEGVFESFAEAILKKKAALLYPHHLPVTPIMTAAIAELIKSSSNDSLQRVRLESKVLELLMLQLDQILSHDCEHFCSLRQDDADRMHTVRELLMHNMDTNYTLERLAKEVGTNEFTLKKGFKEMFGTTVFAFRKNQKMSHARSLLLEGERSIAEVSEVVGYKHPHHFSSAFKKHFGVLPSMLS